MYNFGNGILAAADANYYTGGRTTMDNNRTENMQQNWRVGGTLAFPISKQMSIKLNGSTGVYSRTGSSFDIMGIVWQYRWGGGL